MQHLMLKLDRGLRRHRLVVLVAWIALIAVAAPLAAHRSDRLTDGGYSVPVSQSWVVEDRLTHSFKGVQRSMLAALIVPKRGAGPPQMQAAIGRLAAAVSAVSHVYLEPVARRRALGAIARAGSRQRPLIVPLHVTVDVMKSTDVASALHGRLTPYNGQNRQVALHLVGQSALFAGLMELSKQDLNRAETAGFPIVALILIAVFGSLVAATLPLALGIASLLVTGAIIYLLSLTMEMSVFVTNMASMIGIGVAVDYSLFVLSRYKQEVSSGAPPEKARATALATSGIAVTFSGLTVITSLAGLYLVDSTAVRSMALGAIIVVAVSVLAATSLLPVFISLLGRRVYTGGRALGALTKLVRSRRQRRGEHRTWKPTPPHGFWETWTRWVTRRPAVSAILASAVLLGLAIPALNLNTTVGALHQLPAGNEARRSFESAAALSGPGAFTPVKVLAPDTQASAARRVLSADPEVVHIAPPIPSKDHHSVLLLATLRHNSESPQAAGAVSRMRSRMPSGVLVGGDTAGIGDFKAEVNGSMWKVALFVMSMSFLVLMVLLRSILLPLKAVVVDLLSVGAAFGVLTLVFGTIDTLTPPIILAVVFGLSMDYEVFLLSRIRERYGESRDTTTAVAQGLSSSAATITSAALIMVCVFAVFALTGVPTIQQLGLGSAVAIAIDATVVRLVLVPAVMTLLGRWNWWLPRPLSRLLPEVSVETLGRHAGVAVASSK